MELSHNYFLPFRMRGTIRYFESRPHSIEVLESCQTFKISDEHDWDPTAEMFVSAVERGHVVCASDSYDICMSGSCDVYTCLHEFDLVRGSTTQIMAQIRTSERHHGIDARLLSLKWGIGLEKARDTIKHTTQYNTRSAILPLTRRYRTDLLSQRLKRLSTRFYTDTMFFKVGTSLRGNTCAQVFTNGNGPVFVYPMKSKSEAGNQLLNLIQQVGVPNELHRDGRRFQV